MEKGSLVTKTDQARALLRQGRFDEALSIIVKFRMGFTKEEKRVLEIASESLKGNACFYQKLGIDTNECIAKAKELVNRKYSY